VLEIATTVVETVQANAIRTNAEWALDYPELHRHVNCVETLAATVQSTVRPNVILGCVLGTRCMIRRLRTARCVLTAAQYVIRTHRTNVIRDNAPLAGCIMQSSRHAWLHLKVRMFQMPGTVLHEAQLNIDTAL